MIDSESLFHRLDSIFLNSFALLDRISCFVFEIQSIFSRLLPILFTELKHFDLFEEQFKKNILIFLILISVIGSLFAFQHKQFNYFRKSNITRIRVCFEYLPLVLWWLKKTERLLNYKNHHNQL